MSVNRIHRPNEQNGSTVRTYCVDPLRLRQNNKQSKNQSNNRSNNEPEYSEEFWRKGGSWEARSIERTKLRQIIGSTTESSASGYQWRNRLFVVPAASRIAAGKTCLHCKIMIRLANLSSPSVIRICPDLSGFCGP